MLRSLVTGGAEQQMASRPDKRFEIEDAIQAVLLQQAYKHNPTNLTINIVVGAGMVAMLWFSGASRFYLAAWYCAVVAISLYRAAVTMRLIRTAADFRHVPVLLRRRWQLAYAMGVMSHGALWACLTWVAYATGSIEVSAAILIVLSALAAGATGIFAPQLVLGRIYITLIMLQCTVGLLLKDDPQPILSALGFFFTAVLLFVHNANHSVLYRSLELQFANGQLVEDLEIERQALEKLNATLEERVQARTAELAELVEHDVLTQLLNRAGILRWIHDRTDGAPREQGFAAIFIDLDRFKQINDGLGHAVGDYVLVEIARRLRDVMPDTSALCRWGGDEFVAIVSTSSGKAADSARELVNHLQSALETPLSVLDRSLHVAFTAGIAIAKADPIAISEAIQAADLAAAEAKREGRGSVRFYSDDLFAEQERTMLLAQTLKDAIGKNELTVVFQPIVSSQDFSIVAHEVLLRWDNPILGRVNPDEFIPVAEDTGEIIQIGAYVLDKAVGRFAQMLGEGVSGKLAINVSIRQLVAPDFAGAVRECLARYGVSPDRLVLEVTESIFDARNRPVIVAILEDLDQSGIEIHVDDFGTGYSSLSRLHEMPIRAIKIDQSFVRDMGEQSRAIIEGSVLIARKFGVHVVAEGVETVEQVVQLQNMGVDHLQGYLFGRPQPDFARSGASTALLRGIAAAGRKPSAGPGEPIMLPGRNVTSA